MRIEEAAACAARLIAEERCTWALMRERLAEILPAGTPFPSSDMVESALREHLAIFCPEHERILAAMRAEAIRAMGRLKDAGLETFLTGAVLNGSATIDSNIMLECFPENAKAAETAVLSGPGIF